MQMGNASPNPHNMIAKMNTYGHRKKIWSLVGTNSPPSYCIMLVEIYVCMWMYICVCMHIHVYVYKSIYLCMYIWCEYLMSTSTGVKYVNYNCDRPP